MNVKIPDDELLITRTFDVPATTLFALWSKPEHVKRWIGPSNFVCREAEIDFRVGGAYRVLIASPEHGENLVQRCLSRDHPRPATCLHLRLGQRWSVRGGRDAGDHHFRRAQRQDCPDLPSKTFHDCRSRDSHVGGWTEAFDKLAAYATNIAKEHIK